MAQVGFSVHGRGAIYVHFNSMHALRQTDPHIQNYVPFEILQTTEYTNLYPLVESYIPDNQFVLCGSVTITNSTDIANAIFQATMMTIT